MLQKILTGDLLRLLLLSPEKGDGTTCAGINFP